MAQRRPLLPLLAACALLAALLSARPLAASPADDHEGLSAPPLKLAIFNQVHFHLEVVAGAMFVLKDLTSLPVTVYLPAKVLKTNWYGFLTWMGKKDYVNFRECKEYDGHSTYDLVWFISPEYHINYIQTTMQQMQPKVAMLMVHNGHIPDADFNKLAGLTQPGVPLLTLAPHVARNVTPRVRALDASRPAPDWVLPIFPFVPAKYCFLEDLQGGNHCLKGFSVQGRIESSRRNYSQVWEQLGNHRRSVGPIALENFRLNILGESVEAFSVPRDVRDLVAVYKNPPYAIFYDIVYHSYGLVPMLASQLYYQSKFSSTLLTSLITSVPVIADQEFLDAYTMMELNAVYLQDKGQTELDVMFQVMKRPVEEMWRNRIAVSGLRDKLNERCKHLITGWLAAAGVKAGTGNSLAPIRRLAAVQAQQQQQRQLRASGLPQQRAAQVEGASGRGVHAGRWERALRWWRH